MILEEQELLSGSAGWAEAWCCRLPSSPLWRQTEWWSATGAAPLLVPACAGQRPPWPLLSQLPADQEIAAYCRGPYCLLAVQAVDMLRGQGFEAIRLEEGIQDWSAMGLPVEIGD